MSIEKKWTRREFIRSSAATAAALPLAAKSRRLHAAPPSCVFSPEQEEGPYYVDRELLRSDITDGRIGVPLRVSVRVVNGGGRSGGYAGVDWNWWAEVMM